MSEDEPAEGRGGRRPEGENRLPPALAVLVAALIYALLPESLLFTPRFVIPALEIVLLIALLITNPRRMVRETRVSRIASIALDAVVIAANLVALGLLVTVLDSEQTSGKGLLIAAIQVWVTNVIGFALLYWEIDRGGPVARRTRPRSKLRAADWRFSQDENADTITEVAVTSSKHDDWRPTFVDYLYLSLTNSSAFSPTDTMPLSPRAKLLMGLQASVALFTSLVIVARAIGALGG
ncbi:hypothetical protein MLP_24630 [Microlunatus phosphovorus NM-1]|uniref:DUF1345 domain-containing protein n=1 Tax=Microlunatus phosphovorus (strain ATCC 700054 / DSM 10555 / JCM 9379 / NBRC 101784 / NCIMB 13414 / VKM Ac-1990 / NM-1) TaxID=1032480 RepID=F5XFS0_MICPN|nr:hypothetical protein [Microlunatus phosphovorus]BAK35477.1 hypothetical protein MLP_24630 [Microlunatus phosphovorus NM-1]